MTSTSHEKVEAQAPQLVFVDSFRSVVLASEAPAQAQGNPRHTLPHVAQPLGVLLTSWQATPLLAEGARCGETGVVAVFEQRPEQEGMLGGRPTTRLPFDPTAPL